jgi:hypothetical protein
MSNECYVETLEEMVTELKDNGGDIQNVVVLARVMNEDSEGIFIGMSEDVMDDPSRILGQLELVKGKVFDMMSIKRTAH